MVRCFFVLLLCVILSACQTSQKSKIEKSEKENQSAAPKLTKPVVEKVLIPEKIGDDGLSREDAHWMYFIHGGGTWAR